MATNLRDELIHRLRWRYAVKKFDSTKKIPAEDWEALEAALVLSPSSYGLQPWKFIVVQNPELRKKLTAASWKQTQVEDCSHYVVMTGKVDLDEAYVVTHMEQISKVRGTPMEKLGGYKKVIAGDLITGKRSSIIPDWAARQAYIALGNILTSAALLGIDACPMEGIEPAQYDEILGVKNSGYQTLVGCAFGYRHADDPYAKAAKVRFDAELMIQRL